MRATVFGTNPLCLHPHTVTPHAFPQDIDPNIVNCRPALWAATHGVPSLWQVHPSSRRAAPIISSSPTTALQLPAHRNVPVELWAGPTPTPAVLPNAWILVLSSARAACSVSTSTSISDITTMDRHQPEQILPSGDQEPLESRSND